jgi:type IV pilus assembly protein PilA
MLSTLRKRLERDEDGFTLIELMVVVLIIAILLAIAIPTFLGARNRANDRAAQSSLRNADTAAKTMFSDAETFTGADESATGLTTVEPSLTFEAHGAASGSTAGRVSYKDVSVLVANAGADWYGAVLSKSGSCFYLHQPANGQTTFATVSSSPTCTADAGAALAAASWKGTW